MQHDMPQKKTPPAETTATPDRAPDHGPGTGYGWYALAVLLVVYALNFIDRQMLTIFAADIKRDLKISDADFGFLYGTAFGVFYAVFGIPLGKLADRWHRTRLLALGIATWSAMTAMSGLARGFPQIGLARIGVGVGEATAGPCGYSLLADFFPARRRATAIAIFSTGIYLGGGVALSLGTGLAHAWDHALAPGTRPLGLAGWQAAFLGLGLPGLVMALWVGSLREPRRGRFEAVPQPMPLALPMPARVAWAAFVRDVGAITPPFTLIAAARRGAVALRANLLVLGAVLLVAAGMTRLFGDPAQWIVLGLGVYAVASWAQALRADDPEAYERIWRNRALLGVNVGYGLTCAVGYSASAFMPLYAMETFHASAAQIALVVGGGAAAGGALGVVFGGWLGDRLSDGNRHSRRVVVIMAALALTMAANAVLLTAHSLGLFYAVMFPLWFLTSAAMGGAAGTVVNIVPARLRATATASFFLSTTMLGLALGPYAAGRISQASHSLWLGLASVQAVVPLALIMLFLAWRELARRES